MINIKIFYHVGNWFSLFIMLLLPILGISQSVTLVAPAGEANYQWNVRDAAGVTAISGATNGSYVATTPGVYFATYDANSCGGATNYSIVVDDCGADADYILNLGAVSGTIQWFEGTIAVSGETAATLTVAADSVARTFYANVTPTNGCTTKSPEFTIINLNDCEDTDGDGVADVNDDDDDNDGIPDIVEIMTALNGGDTDGDGIPDHQDLDSDNDGINDIIEAGGTDNDNDGLVDTPGEEGTITNPIDTDMDGTPDYQEVDSDNDGTFDIEGTVDAGEDNDDDGMIDDDTDTDGDGIPDVTDDNTGFGDANDTDGDGISDADDLDDDDDGIPDLIEIATSTNGGDTDGDGIPDHQDLDSDNDGINDIVEAGLTDTDDNGMVDTPGEEGSVTNPTDTDMDGTPDFQETDSNNDGMTDISGTSDASLDTNGDGMIDDPTDTDRDGIKDPVDGMPLVFGDAPRGIVLSVTILLQGPYNSGTGLISDNLVRSSLLPLTEPYTGLGYTHINGGGGESISSTVLATTGPTSVVDWIFLELRDPSTLVDILETRSALLLANGKIVDLDGVSPVRFNNSTNNSYYVAVRHRNHLGVMTPGALSLTNTVTAAHDFTNGSSFGNINGDAQKSLGGGKFGLFEADFNGDEQINAADRSIAWNSRNLTGYRTDDSSFNGVCDAAERSQCWNNRNLNSKIP